MTTNAPRLLALSLLLVLPCSFAKSPVATGSGGAVATISEQASRSALAILNQGGNAVDAAVAAAATLGVTDPFSCGIGGGGFMMIYLAKENRVITIDHRETAPAAATTALFQHEGGELPFADAVASGLSVGVPGTVRGWDDALRRYGSMGWRQVMVPAIRVAEQGFTVSPTFHRFIASNEPKFRRFTSSSALYLKNGKALAAGTRFRNPGMAKAYRALAARGPQAFYSGPLARAIVQAVTQPPLAPGHSALPGALTMADLANYESRIRQPVRTTYRGYEIFGMAPPSSGGVTIGLALNILEGYDLKTLARADAEHLYLEASKLAFADRNAYLADPEFTDVPVAGLLSKDYATGRRRLIDPAKARAVTVQGDPYLFQADASVPLRRESPHPRAESLHTTHLAVSDKHGNIVAYTFTIEDWGGSGIVVPGYGFLLNNELTDFTSTAGRHPNLPEAFKRPRSSMAPTMAFKDGRPAFTVGSPGGATIITTVLQTIVNHIDLKMPMARAIDAPRISQLGDGEALVEPGFAQGAQARALERLGHRWTKDAEEIGAANAIVFNQDGTVTAVSEGWRHGIGSALVQKPAH